MPVKQLNMSRTHDITELINKNFDLKLYAET